MIFNELAFRYQSSCRKPMEATPMISMLHQRQLETLIAGGKLKGRKKIDFVADLL